MTYEVYWSYNGFVGDKFSFQPNVALAERFAPKSRTVGLKLFSWLNQRGFGPGYFNNSGEYAAYRKSVFKTEADRQAALELMLQSCWAQYVKVFDSKDAFDEAVARTKQLEKIKHKDNPF